MNATTFENALMGLHHNLINYALMLTSERRQAEKLVHETTVKALDCRDHYALGSDFKGWVFNMMRDIFLERYVGRAPGVKVVDRTDSAVSRVSFVSESSIAGLDSVNEVHELSRRISNLSRDASVVYTLYAVGDTPDEISVRLSMLLSRVKTLLRKAHADINRRRDA